MGHPHYVRRGDGLPILAVEGEVAAPAVGDD
jgi:hypothetical protein